MYKKSVAAALVMFFLIAAHAGGDGKTAGKSWEKDGISIQVKIPAKVNLSSEKMDFEINIINRSKEGVYVIDLARMYGYTKIFNEKLVTLPSGSKVELTEQAQAVRNSPTGNFEWVEIAPQKTYSVQMDLKKYFVIDRKSDYSLNVSGMLYLMDQRIITFSIDGIVFSVE